MTENQSTSSAKVQQMKQFTRAALWDSVNRHADAYRVAFPQNSEADLKMVASYCAGLSIDRASQILCCAEDDIQKAIIRVQTFVQNQELNDWWQPLLDHIIENPPSFGDCNAQNLLEMLYEKYCDWNDFTDDATRESIRAVNERLKHLSIPEIDSVMDIVYRICRNHQRTGFCEGIKIGIRLAEELNI